MRGCQLVSLVLQGHEASQVDEPGWQLADAGAVCMLKIGKD